MDILTIVKTKWRALWKQDAMQPPLRLNWISVEDQLPEDYDWVLVKYVFNPENPSRLGITRAHHEYGEFYALELQLDEDDGQIITVVMYSIPLNVRFWVDMFLYDAP